MVTETARRELLERRAVGLCRFSAMWNATEGVIAVASGLAAGSVALTSWGIDSGIEVVTAVLVVIHLQGMLAGRDGNEARERRYLRIVAATFYALAVYVVVDATITLISRSRTQTKTSPGGIAISGAALVVMPILGVAKRRIGRELGNELVIADGAETMICAALAAATLAGLVARAVFGWSWVDPIAGYLITYFCIKEGREAAEGELVCVDDGCADRCGD